MTIEKMFGIESDEEYFAKSENERIAEVAEYIAGISSSGNYEEGWSIEYHIESLKKDGILTDETADKVLDMVNIILGRIQIYKNYGCLSAEKSIIYTYGVEHPTAICSDVITVKIPDGWEKYKNESGEIIVTAPWGENYTIHDVLYGNDTPKFRTFGHGGGLTLEVVN